MSGRPVDLRRVRRALNELDRIAAEHPEIIGSKGQWSESAVQSIMKTPPKAARERVADFRQRMIQAGRTRICFYAAPETKRTLDALKNKNGATIEAVIADALQQYWAFAESDKGGDHAV